jgi:uncharacterized membrane protein
VTTATFADVPVDRNARAYRVESIDIVRGLVIVIMALDHVRDFVMVAASSDPMTDPNVGASLFFTRWITHFCAPVFVCLAGVSAGLMATRKTARELAVFLLTRGLWLIGIEMVVLANLVTFSPFGLEPLGGGILIVMQVIWAIGASMMVLAGAQFLGQRACLAIGAAIVLGHNLVDPVWPMTNGPIEPGPPLWVSLHAQMGYAAGPFYFAFIYPVVAWIGVMLLGFGAAPIWSDTPAGRSRRLLAYGCVAVVAFLALRVAGVYGDPNPWHVQNDGLHTVMDFINVTKYPPSLLFLLMTLGPAAMLCAWAERLPRAIRQPFVTFGRAPFAFYVAHILVIHLLSMAVGVAQGFDASQFVTVFFFYPQGYGVELPGVYLLWLLVVALLYPFCAWVGAIKQRRRDWWLSYV